MEEIFITGRIFVALILITLSASSCREKSDCIKIPFENHSILIDGLPDRVLEHIPWSEFPVKEKTDSLNPEYIVRYKAAYNLDNFYFIIAVSSDSITYRDRAYQNGDGIHLVIARPDATGSTDEFYVLRFSPADPRQGKPARNSVWYYNVALQSKQLSSNCKFVCSSSEGKTYFELLVPFTDINPYNPLFRGSMGFNLCFVKAIGEKEKNYYLLCKDENIQSEQCKRKYVPAIFGQPGKSSGDDIRLFVPYRNIMTGDSVPVNILITGNTGGRTSLDVSVHNESDSLILSERKEFHTTGEVTRKSFSLPVEKALPGEYLISWKAQTGDSGNVTLTVLPGLTLASCIQKVSSLKSSLSQGDYNSLCFAAEDIFRKRAAIKDYEDASWFLKECKAFKLSVSSSEKDHLYLSERSGVFRRAFRSNIDSTLQPYSVRIPEGFTRSKKFPLFVMLHGSGSDDTGMLESGYTSGKFIELAPYGRGTSNCFTTDNAEKDVREAIEDVIRNYPVDTARIVIAGFSMGGYGAYRIFYEYPALFKGVAVFSGHPSLATKWLGPGYPDFLKDEYLLPFRNVPVFIYHCKDDLNCPFDLTGTLVTKLEAAGAKVKFLSEPTGGHGILNSESKPEFLRWLLTSF